MSLKSKALLSGGIWMLLGSSLPAKENTPHGANGVPAAKSLQSGCATASAYIDLEINNVRARLFNGGELWMDNVSGINYEVPIYSGKNSLYAGSLWIGGIDAASQLKIAAQTYRQSGNDFYPGPLNSSAATDAATCLSYDKFWELRKDDVISYHNWILTGAAGPCPVSAATQQTIVSWPATGPEGQHLAPYYDYNGDGFYDPAAGDYPAFNIDGSAPCGNYLLGDEAIWWVFNDAGNTHTESGGAAMGLEIQAQAFAYATSDDIDNVTFYKYVIINKSSYTYNNTYFGQWTDPDLGAYNDDYVGCDVSRGLGYAYNGAATDAVYGANPPAVGIDILEGPFADIDFTDNAAASVPPGYSGYGDGITDNEHIGMAKFVYYYNNTTSYGNPVTAGDYYNYLQGRWKDNTPMTYGGNGHSGSTACNYMFPSDSDPYGYGVGGTSASPVPEPVWTEVTAGDAFGDRRFLQSAGPFTFLPGSVQTWFNAVVWAQAGSGGPQASLQKLMKTDSAAQNLFDHCFVLTSGSTGIQEHSSDVGVTFYPNPFTETATLSFKKLQPDVYSLKIYNTGGRLVRLYNNIGDSQVTIVKNELAAGTYIYLLFDAQKQVASGKFIIR